MGSLEKDSIRPLARLLVFVLLALVLTHAFGSVTGHARNVVLAAAATPGPGAETIYAVTNPNAATLNVQHVFTDSSGFNYSFSSQVPPNSTVQYHVSQMPQIPSPFNGSLSLHGDQPFTAQIVGYDYPSTTPTATATARTATATPTAAASRTPTPTGGTPTPTPSAARTATVTPTATGQPGRTLFSDGFEESSFSAGGWMLDVAGSGATAQLVSSPTYAGRQAAQFGTQTQQQGEHAFVQASVAWPSAHVVEAQAMVQLPARPSIEFPVKVLGLEAVGPTNWATRAGLALGSRDWETIATTRDGVVHYTDTGLAYLSGQWLTLSVTVDERGPNPLFTYAVNGTVVGRLSDTSSGSNTDPPAALRVGFGPGDWGTNQGTVVVDAVTMAIPGSPATATVTPTARSATATATPTAKATPTATATATPPRRRPPR